MATSATLNWPYLNGSMRMSSLTCRSHGLHDVVHAFCEDLLVFSVGTCWTDACLMDSGLLRKVLDEVDDPALQRKVMSLCISLVEADQHLTDNESRVLAATALLELLRPVRRSVQLNG